MFAIMERSWHNYAAFGLMLTAFSLWGWYEIGEWNGFLGGIMFAGVFAFSIALIVRKMDSKKTEGEN